MRSHHRFITLVATWLLLTPLGARAQGTPGPADKTLSPYFLVEGGDPSIDRLPLKDTQVSVAVAVAGVVVDVGVAVLVRVAEGVAIGVPVSVGTA